MIDQMYLQLLNQRVQELEQVYLRQDEMSDPKIQASLEAENIAIQTGEARKTWKDVKFRARQRDNVNDWEYKSFDSGIPHFSTESATQTNFLKKGNHRNV